MRSDDVIDLRSDTVTRPSLEMRRAMAEAEVGDDVLDGDPTTGRLERRIAELLGMEAALFFPSGTQANQTAIWLLAERGTEIILEASAHLVHYEKAGLAALAGVQVRPVPTPDGLLTAELVRDAWRGASRHLPRIGAVAVENTHNAAGGRVLPLATWDALVAEVQSRDVALHLDGARLWHAAVALRVPPAKIARGATLVMVSLSKGLGCPVGSCLAGSRELIERAWEIRRRLGGGMRQSGILAAAGLFALDRHLPELERDHVHAARLAQCLAELPGVRVVQPESNIVMVDLLRPQATAAENATRLAAAGVLVVPFGARRLRAVTHRDVGKEDVERAAGVMAELLR